MADTSRLGPVPSSESRDFGLGDVLSVTSGILVSRRRVDGVCDVLQFMVGEPVWTHQIPRVCGEVTPEILRQHPRLASIAAPTDWPDGDDEAVAAAVYGWLDALEAEHGATVSLRPLSEPLDHTSISPLDELAMMRPDMEAFPVVAPEDPPA